jgi:hypothetical protein
MPISPVVFLHTVISEPTESDCPIFELLQRGELSRVARLSWRQWREMAEYIYI